VSAILPRHVSPYWFVLLAVLAGAALLVERMHWDDRGLLWLKERHLSKGGRAASVWLPDYRAVIQGKPLPGLERGETSDLAYSPLTGTLFTITGKRPQLVELSRSGEVLRRIPLHGLSNPEGVAVLEDGNLAIVDERQRTLSVVPLEADTRELNLSDYQQFDLGYADAGNKGFEGVAWDPRQQRLLLGKERGPLALFSLPSDGGLSLQGALQELLDEQLPLRNLSALSVDPRTGHLLVLSADSHLLLELDEHGEPLSFISLIGGLNGLHSKIPRAEGVAMDEAGDIYMVSEPNLFYVFRKDAADPTAPQG